MATTDRRLLFGPLRSVFRTLNWLALAFVSLGFATIVCSAGRPPALGAQVKAVQVLPGKGIIVYGTLRGTFGPLRRGFGQMIGRAGLDLVTDDGRYLTLPGCIEEPSWQGVAWPFNWWRTEVWFSEMLPGVRGFTSVRVRLQDRLGNERSSALYPMSGGPGTAEIVPDDARWLALPGIVLGPQGADIVADETTLESPRR